jgi:hypothetical protein
MKSDTVFICGILYLITGIISSDIVTTIFCFISGLGIMIISMFLLKLEHEHKRKIDKLIYEQNQINLKILIEEIRKLKNFKR